MKALRASVAGVMVAFLLSIGLVTGGAQIAQAAQTVGEGVAGYTVDGKSYTQTYVPQRDVVIPDSVLSWGSVCNTSTVYLCHNPQVAYNYCDHTPRPAGCWAWDASNVMCMIFKLPLELITNTGSPGSNCYSAGGSGGGFQGGAGCFDAGCTPGNLMGQDDWCSVNRCGGWNGVGATPVSPLTGIVSYTVPGLDLLDGKSQIKMKPGELKSNGWVAPGSCTSISQCQWVQWALATGTVNNLGFRDPAHPERTPLNDTVMFRASCLTPTGTHVGIMSSTRRVTEWAALDVPGLDLYNIFAGATVKVCLPGYTVEWLEWDGRGTGPGVKISENGVPTAPRCGQTSFYICIEPGLWKNPNAAPTEAQTIFRSTLVCAPLTGDPSATKTLVKESSPGSGVVPQLVCEDGYKAISGKLESKTVFAVDWQLLSSWELPPAAAVQYPECAGTSAAGCTLAVWVNGSVCTQERSECGDWYNGIYRTSPSKVKCKWGPYEMPIKDCLDLINAYQCEVGLMKDPKRPNSAAPVCILADGVPVSSNNDPGYKPPANSGTGNGADPGTGTDPGPGAESCWPTGFGIFNPIAWVLQPAKCALSWAFVPKTADLTSIGTGLKSAIDGIGFGTALNGLTAPVNAMGAAATGSGCSGPVMNFDVAGIHQTLKPFDACTGVMATVAGYARAIISMIVIVSGGISVVRALASGFGFSFNAGKGGDES